MIFSFFLACQSADHKVTDTGQEVASDTADIQGWRSSLYPDGWTPEHSVGEHFLHDFSYAGYKNGEVEPPESLENVFSVLDYGADSTGVNDSCPAIQSAVDAASVSGGVVYLPAGEYRCEDRILIRASNVLIDGDGPESTFLYFTRSNGMSDSDHLDFRGQLTNGVELPLVEDGENRSHHVSVQDASALNPGDEVSLGWFISPEFVTEHEMDLNWVEFNGLWKSFFRRTVVSIDTESTPNRVELDVPLRYPAKVRDSASLLIESGYLSGCGVQDLSVSTVVGWDEAWSVDRSHAVGMDMVKDCWVRNIASYSSPNSSDNRQRHLMSGGVLVKRSKRVSVMESELSLAQNRGGGGNGYLYEVSRSSEVLIRDCVGRSGRHNFIQNWDFGTSGLVFLRTLSEDGHVFYGQDESISSVGTSEFHHSLAMASLIDASVTHDGWKAVNRMSFSSGAGHTATQSVFWNTGGTGLLFSYQFGDGYIIGTRDIEVHTEVTGAFETAGTAPEDYTEGIGDGGNIYPSSLYEDQLRLRLARGEGIW